MTNELQDVVSTAASVEKLGVIGILFLVLLGVLIYNYYLTRDIKRTLEAIERNLERQNEIFSIQIAFFKEHLYSELKNDITQLKEDVEELLDHCKETNAIKYAKFKGDI